MVIGVARLLADVRALGDRLHCVVVKVQVRLLVERQRAEIFDKASRIFLKFVQLLRAVALSREDDGLVVVIGLCARIFKRIMVGNATRVQRNLKFPTLSANQISAALFRRRDGHGIAARQHRRLLALVEMRDFRRIGHGAAVSIVKVRGRRVVKRRLHLDRLAVADFVLDREVNEIRRLDFKARLQHSVTVDRIVRKLCAQAVCARGFRLRCERLAVRVEEA